jgi:ABC-type branched-subunit amino acid transport system substrate-binding protein
MASLALVGCSSSGAGGGTASPSAIPQLAGPAIKVGMIADLSQSSAIGNAQPERHSAAQAAVDAINIAGGINGKRLELVVCDEKGDPNKAAACARELVSKGIVASVSDASLFGDRLNPPYLDAGVPRIGALPLGPAEYTAPNNYPLSGGAVTMIGGDILWGKRLQLKTAALMGVESPQSSALPPLMTPVFERTGIAYKKNIEVPVNASDLSTYVTKIKQSGVDFVVAGLNPALAEQFLVTSKQLGAKYKMMFPGGTISQETIDKVGSAAEGIYIASPYPTVTSSGFRTVDQFNREMDDRQARGDANATPAKREPLLETWLAVHAFAAVADTVPGTITRASLTKALQGAKNVNIGDATAPWTPSGGTGPLPRITNNDGYFLEVKDGKIVLASPHRVRMY